MEVKEATRAFGNLDTTKGEAFRKLTSGSGDRAPRIFTNTKRKVGAIALTVALFGAGIFGAMIDEKLSPNEARPATGAIFKLMRNKVIDESVARRLDPEDPGVYDESSHLLTLNIKGDNGQICEAPFQVTDKFDALEYTTTYANGEVAQSNPAKNPTEVKSDLTRFLGSQACKPTDK
ncbi:MAG: hypothetical protein ACXWLH_02145 [Candidatus Saccharimonadales bacterium]